MNIRLLTAVLVILLLYGCPPCDPIMLDNGPLPDSILTLVPYQDGETYRLKHSNGQVISFTARRYTEKELMDCHYCCDFTINYENNITQLTPDYPVFAISLMLSNADTIRYDFSCNIGKYFLNVPVKPDPYAVYVDFADSLLVGDNYYYDVFKIKPYNHSLWNEPIKVDSVFYNNENGILLIKMTNEEYYSIID